MTIDELAVGITVDLSGLRDGLARAQEEASEFGAWMRESSEALADGTVSALREVQAAGGATAGALEQDFAQAFVGVMSGAEGLRGFWQTLWRDLLRIVLQNLTAIVSEGQTAAAVLQRTFGGLLSGGLGGSGLLGVVSGLLGGLFGSGGHAGPQTRYTVSAPSVSETYGALPTTAATAARATQILSVVVRVEPGAVQLSPAAFDAESARQAARSLFDEIRNLFETEDLAEGLATA